MNEERPEKRKINTDRGKKKDRKKTKYRY